MHIVKGLIIGYKCVHHHHHSEGLIAKTKITKIILKNERIDIEISKIKSGDFMV